jgi:hypothetical protein
MSTINFKGEQHASCITAIIYQPLEHICTPIRRPLACKCLHVDTHHQLTVDHR